MYLYFIFLLPFSSVFADELLFVNIIYRHGDRTPVKPYPKDPYKNLSFWPNGFGQLTNRGKRQHFEFGQWLRKRYADFLPEKYSLNDIYVRSTDVDRTLMSAEANLAGLYAPIDSDVWNPSLEWQPIPIHTIPEKMDAVLSAQKNCPTYNTELRKVQTNEKFRKINLQLQPLYQYLTTNSGKRIEDIQELEYLYNTLFIENLYKLKLPNWTNEVFPDKLLPWAKLSFTFYCYNPTLQRLKVGLLMNEIVTRFVNKTKGFLKPDRKMWVYSAHDTTIANVLMALGAFEPHCPPYTSSIIIELRFSVSDGYYVSAFYKNDTEAKPISILKCDLKCPMDQFLTLLNPIMLTQNTWEDECNSLNFSDLFIGRIILFTIIGSAAFLILVKFMFYLRSAYLKRQNYRHRFYQPLNDDVN